jgi:cysteinyl-tRNA synthetase
MDYASELRKFIMVLDKYGKSLNPNFSVIGNGQIETMYYNDEERPLLRGKKEGMTIIVIDYCTTPSKINDSYAKNNASGFLSWASDMQLNKMPKYPVQPYYINNWDINKLSDAKNIFFIINPETFNSQKDIVSKMQSLNYDVVVTTNIYEDPRKPLNSTEMNSMKKKPVGGKKKIYCYLALGEAMHMMPYFKANNLKGCSGFLGEMNPLFPGSYKAKYWMKGW